VGFLKNLRDTPQKDLRFLCSTIHGQKITRPSNMQQPSNIYQQPSKNSRFFPVRTSKPQSFGRAQLRHFFCYSSMCVAGLVASMDHSLPKNFAQQQTPTAMIIIWLVVSTPLKNISQLGWLFPIYGKMKNVPNHQSVMIFNDMQWLLTFNLGLGVVLVVFLRQKTGTFNW